MRRNLAAVFASLALLPAALYACSDDTTPGTAVPAEAGSETSTPEGGGADAAVDTSTAADTSMPPAAVRCTQAEFDAPAGPNGGDFTGFAGVDITFPTTGAPAQYKQRCAKVKVDADVTFAGSFEAHPLAPSGGDTPTPIPTQSTTPDGGALTFKVPNKGTFGFECAAHPTTMFGAIQVVQ